MDLLSASMIILLASLLFIVCYTSKKDRNGHDRSIIYFNNLIKSYKDEIVRLRQMIDDMIDNGINEAKTVEAVEQACDKAGIEKVIDRMKYSGFIRYFEKDSFKDFLNDITIRRCKARINVKLEDGSWTSIILGKTFDNDRDFSLETAFEDDMNVDVVEEDSQNKGYQMAVTDVNGNYKMVGNWKIVPTGGKMDIKKEISNDVERMYQK